MKAFSQTFFLGQLFSRIDKLYDFAFIVLHGGHLEIIGILLT